MSEDYEPKRTDLHAAGQSADAERPAAEDPLLELARIVQKNKQSGADVSSGRVGSTDYFAGLNDFAEDPQEEVPTSQSSGRIEPSFVAVQPVADNQNQGGDASPLGDQPGVASVSQAAAPEPAVFSSAAQSPTETVPSTHVSSLWPKVPESEPSEEVASVVPAQERIAPVLQRSVEPQASTFDQPSTQALATQEPETPASLTPTVALDLEQNLTAELEDELIGALRQSVDDTPEPSVPPVTVDPAMTAAIETPTQDFAVPRVDPISQTEAVVRPKVRDLDFEQAIAVDPEPVRAPDVEAQPAPSVKGYNRDDFSVNLSANPAREAEQKVAQQEADFGTPAVSAQFDDDRRPRIDESDLFAALNPAEAEPAPVVRPAGSAALSDAEGIEALFADLEFPDPAERKAQISSDEAAKEVQTAANERASTADIDEMSWPAAAGSVPRLEDDETPPPPEGYDLDAVARAMQESDPSLSGEGVLPPHPAAEKQAVPQAQERSRRGLFVAGGILGVAVLGAAGFFLMDGSSVQVPSGPPPIISGLQEPLKIYPEQSQAPTDNQSAKLIYDRIDGTGETGPDQLVRPESPQPAELPPAPAGANGNADLLPGAPKRVRTLVVRPDGSIISGGEAGAPPVATPEPTVAAVEQPVVPAPAAPTPAPAAPSVAANSETPRVVSTTPVVPGSVSETPVAAAPASSPAQATQAETPVAATPDAAAPTTPAIVAGTETPAAVEPVQPVPTVLPRKKPAAPVQVARAPAAATTPAPASQNNGPLNLGQQNAAAPAPATTAPAAAPATNSGSIPAGTYIVQVTSQRSEQAASNAYSGLQRQFPGILGNRDAVIVSANVQDRGVFYRARIPTGSREEAISLCESLKGAGGDCFVRRQ
ncbi:SPOR domain-containing protein [uncultured Roseibium sp.]|uniref:SPOR domain-containing protein n=1 Tax=uncultured Roseibium sp. TaxID=1936171 RepID=UPI00262B76E8|nr:SPOR domain-containing protein [uncultured Roseibium sp.]